MIYCQQDDLLFILPDSSSEERIKRIKPVVHLFVISSLKKYSTVFCTHRKRVGGLLRKEQQSKKIVMAQEDQKEGNFSDLCVKPLTFSIACWSSLYST